MSEEDSEFINWRHTMGYDILPHEDIIDIGIKAYIYDDNSRLWRIIKITDFEAVNWMFTNRDVLNTIYKKKILNTFIEILSDEIVYLNNVGIGAAIDDGKNRLFTKKDAIEMKSILERNLKGTPPPHIPPPPNLLKLFNDGPPANGGYRRRNKRSKKQSKKSKKSRKSKTSRRR